MKYFFFISFSLISYCNAQIINPSIAYQFDYSATNITYKGNVKKVKLNFFSAKTSSIKLQQTRDSLLNNNQLKYFISIDSFDINRNKVFELKKEKLEGYQIKYYTYDSNNNLVGIISKYLDSDTIINEWKLKYNSNNKLANSQFYYKGYLVVEHNYAYNKNGEVESREILSENYCLEKVQKKGNRIIVNTYNITGKKMVKQEYVEDDSSIYCHYYFYTKYNAAGKEGITRQSKKLPNIFFSYQTKNDEGEFVQNWAVKETQYDEHKNLTKLFTFDEIKKVNLTTIINYKYDTVGNIIEQLITYDNGNQELVKFEFQYY